MTAASLAALLVCTGVLTACGGGGSDSPAASGAGGAGATQADSGAVGGGAAGATGGAAGGSTGGSNDGSSGAGDSATTKVPMTVIDGPINKAVVCFDMNLNGACDVGEPSGVTGADGKVDMTVAAADVGKYPMIAVIGSDAVDRDWGPVTTPYTMKAPADTRGVVSPLTTLVQAQMDKSGGTSAAAEAALKSQLGIAGSLFEDYTAASDATSEHSAMTARLIVVVTQKYNAALATALGAPDSSGSTVSQADLSKAVNESVLGMLPAIKDVVTAQPSGATPAQFDAALGTAAGTLVDASGLTPTSVAAVVGGNKVIAASAKSADDSVTIGWNLRWFQFTDLNNWSLRANEITAAQAVPDANGLIRYSEYRERSVNGVETGYGADPSYNRTDLYWDGAAWWNCPTNFEHTTTVRDATGAATSTFCKTIVSTSKRGTRDISGSVIADIIREIRAYPFVDAFGVQFGGFAQWGPDPASGIYGTARFPAGSTLIYQSYSDLTYPDSYKPGDVLTVSPADVAAGPTCPDAPTSAPATSLDQVLARNRGTPCLYTASAQTGSRNEWWGNSSVSIGTIASSAAPSSSYYASTRQLRVAFGDNSSATYLNCAVRASNASPRNCDVAGTGSYSIETVGDARVMRLANVPAIGTLLTYDRLLVERAGGVYLGSRTKPVSGNQLRLNDVAASAMFRQIGLPQLAD